MLSTYGFILSVLVQIFARIFLPSAPSWTEEASRLCFIYSIGFGAGLAFASNEFIYLEWFYNKFSARFQRVVLLVIGLCSVLLFACMFWYSIDFMRLGHAEYSPGMKFRMSFAFASMVLLSASMTYYTLVEFISDITSRNQ